MSQSKFNAATRSANVAAKSIEFVVKDVKFPDRSADFVSIFKASSAAVIKLSAIYTVDVFPNFVPILMYIQYHCVKTIAALDDRKSAKVTLPTYVMYCLTIVYGFILLNDLHIRPSKSVFALDYYNIPDKLRFSQLLLTLPVPNFLNRSSPIFDARIPFTLRTSSSAPPLLVSPSPLILDDFSQ
jgi:hypothetical protein